MTQLGVDLIQGIVIGGTLIFALECYLRIKEIEEAFKTNKMCKNCEHFDSSIVLPTYPPKGWCNLAHENVYLDQKECIAKNELF